MTLTPDTASSQAARDWIQKFASGDITEADLASYGEWVSQPANEQTFQHELKLWRSLGAIADRLEPEQSVAQIKIAHRDARRRRTAGVVTALAACLILMVAAPDISLRLRADHISTKSITSVRLPDGSRAMLDADAAISVQYDGSERTVELLRGRAWFDVAHAQSRPFRVMVGSAVVEDIGTSFEVSKLADGGQAAVTQGLVRVRSDGEPWTMLAAGQRAAWTGDDGVIRGRPLPEQRIATWRTGEIILESVPVRQAVEEIARYREGATFMLGDFAGHAPVTAILHIDKADEGLDALVAGAGLRILRLPAGITIIRPAE